MDTCPLCSRVMVDGPSVNDHHLIPKTFGGKETRRMHRICHRAIHSIFSEREMAKYYHTFERMLEREEVQVFVRWVQKKEPEFYASMKDSSERKRRRRR
jgi:hypothetical protein